MMKVLIVEDEAVASRRLSKMVLALGMEIVEACESSEALNQYLTENDEPDLYLMDIHLSDGNVFDFLSQIELKSPIIFTTAFDEYAIRAFKQNSIDYLLKPIDQKELSNAVEKYKSTLNSPRLDIESLRNLLSNEKKYRTRLRVQIGNHIKTVPISEIPAFYSESKISFCNYQGRSYPLDEPLAHYSEHLSPDQFFQVSRNFIVNIKFIDDVIKFSSSRLQVKLKGLQDKEIIVSRDRVRDFKAWLG